MSVKLIYKLAVLKVRFYNYTINKEEVMQSIVSFHRKFISRHSLKSAKFFLLFLICLLPACASKSPQSIHNSVINSQSGLTKEALFASQLGNAPTNTPFFAEWTPFDVSSTITVGQAYVSALGETCRQAVLENNNCQKRIAVCQYRKDTSSSMSSWRLESVISISKNVVNQECL